ncbi:MAG: aminomethyltransferase family protein [Nitrospiria bacterium]
MPQLILHDEHQSAGARFAPYGEWALPEDYGDALQEYHAVRERVGLADLSYQGNFLVTGSDRVAFLQGLISNDMALLSKERGIYSTLLTAKGRVVADFYLYPLSDGLLMELEWANAAKTKEHLIRYRLRSQVKIDAPPWGRILIAGPRSKSLLEALFKEALPPMKERSLLEITWGGFSLLCIKRSITGEEDYHLYLSEEGIVPLWMELLSLGHDLGVLPVGQAALEILRIEAGKPRYGVDIDEHIIPVEAGLADEAISYTKGCFPGQEVVARIKTYGHVNKHLYGMVLEGSELPQREDKVFKGDKQMGWVTSAARSPYLGKVIAIGYLRPQIAVPGTTVEVEVGNTRTTAQATPLPFYQRKNKTNA